jgi:Zn finger protein HypA/HybF involved in hydrogenase expression
MNSDLHAGGYIEYTITNPTAEAREQEAVMIAIIIAITTPIIIVGVIAGIAVPFKNKNRRIKELEQELREAPKNIYCRECGAEFLDKEGTYCSKCGCENN